MLTSLQVKFSHAFTKKQKIDSELNQSKVALTSGDFDLAAKLANNVLNDRRASKNSILTARFVEIQVRSRQGLFTGVLDELDSLYRRVPRANVEFQAKVGNEMIRACFRSGNLAIGAQRGEEFLRKYEQVWPEVDLVELLCQLSSCHFHRGDSARAEEIVNRALLLAEKCKSAKAFTQTYWQSSLLNIHKSDLALALQQVMEAKRWAQIAELQNVMPILNNNAALIMLDLPNADLTHIHELAESAYLDIASQNDPGGTAYTCEILSEVALRREEYESALVYAQKGLNELPAEIPGPRASLLVQVAKVHARMGNYPEAKTRLHIATDHMEQLEPSRELAKQWGDVARVFVEVGLTDRGVYAYEKAIQMSGLLREEQDSKVN